MLWVLQAGQKRADSSISRPGKDKGAHPNGAARGFTVCKVLLMSASLGLVKDSWAISSL